MSRAEDRNRAPRPYTGRGADSYAAKLLAKLAHPSSSYRDADPEPVTRCEPMECEKCSRVLTAEDEGALCWLCLTDSVKQTNVTRLDRATPKKRSR